ncbi:hypothetical protein PTSG_04427 [Salpingoeca rosetta]|uniref:GH18 domain-containing protein n=1 Tax=Salpingoeca rosetta (strain ATCC 50818 / BSB-021) TaxID=946362 RepID=F2U8J0_SALR5|nr:uncharacterized protein PTSG_04427 [Salpingoeca rosetta]EGD72698.1 hypothetical protein PTSG_04427 [Salpingoeca rosetta]|eukprot:XP_004994521.1 hypothetical protein PTSG_04427 [Salpingoeca rosetta]
MKMPRFSVAGAVLMATLALCAGSFLAHVRADADTKFVGGYILMSATRNGHAAGLDELASLADNAKSLPVSRVIIGFFDPTMVYMPGSQTLNSTGLNASSTGDYGFAKVKESIGKLQKGGVEVFLSLGGWNYNCFPYLYMRYSVGGYGTHTPNYWKIDQYGQGNMSNCNDANQYCWVCEPPSEGTDLSDFAIFPTVPGSDTWQQAVKFVESNAKGNETPAWHYEMVPGRPWTDPKTGIQVQVPGRYDFVRLNRDPYQDFVYLAKDLGVDGIDLDYEEFWHADYFKYGNGPWWLPQTVYKYAAIAKTLILHIQNIMPKLKLSTAASAVGGWSSSWWGGNLKTSMYYLNLWYPSLVDFMTKGKNAGGVNVMTYDLSDNPEFHECPEPNICSLSDQVKFYMQQYKAANIPANVGYEIGTPAYPSPKHDPTHQLPLTKAELQKIISEVQGDCDGGFFWELFKPYSSGQASPTDTAQAICSTVLGDADRCSGSVPTPPSK